MYRYLKDSRDQIFHPCACDTQPCNFENHSEIERIKYAVLKIYKSIRELQINGIPFNEKDL